MDIHSLQRKRGFSLKLQKTWEGPNTIREQEGKQHHLRGPQGLQWKTEGSALQLVSTILRVQQ